VCMAKPLSRSSFEVVPSSCDDRTP